MVAPVYSNEDFAAAFQALFPRGLVWPRDADAVQADVCASFAPTYKRQSDASSGLLQDSPAFSLNQLLTEWENTLGLPDLCAGPDASFSQRVAQVIAKLSIPGGQSAKYFIDLATKLGFTHTSITTFAPFRCGRSHCGEPCANEDWIFTWVMNAPDIPVTYFRTGLSFCGDPLYSLGADELQCTIEHYAPAHTTVLFSEHP